MGDEPPGELVERNPSGGTRLSAALRREIEACVRARLPNEAAGSILRTPSGELRFEPWAASEDGAGPAGFLIRPAEHLRTRRRWRERGERLVAHVHSHPDGNPTPSPIDLDFQASDGDADLDPILLIVSSRGNASFAAWRVEAGGWKAVALTE
jgi:proteasome lid subunit RPN8/RPN11